jgi:hypothetical protein
MEAGGRAQGEKGVKKGMVNIPVLSCGLLILFLPGCTSVQGENFPSKSASGWWDLSEYAKSSAPKAASGGWWDLSEYTKSSAPKAASGGWWDPGESSEKFVLRSLSDDPPFRSIREWWALRESPEDFANRKDYNAVLTRSADNQYILNYEGVYQGESFRGELSAPSLRELLDTMRQRPAEFNQASIDTVRVQAGLIPAEYISERELNGIKQAINDFYLSPTQAKFNVLAEKYRTYNFMNGNAGRVVAESIFKAVYAFNSDLAAKLIIR